MGCLIFENKTEISIELFKFVTGTVKHVCGKGAHTTRLFGQLLKNGWRYMFCCAYVLT